MSKYLFIVESPGKVHKIQGLLGSDYKVMASVGHIREIPKKGLGIDVEKGFEPIFEISSDKKDVVKKIKEESKKAEIIYLATDPDREGEGIAKHLKSVLDKNEMSKCKRVTYNEITKKAIIKAIENAGDINENLADAQKARQVLDRLIGYKISPLLWNDVAAKTSAGRVQSVALKIVSERENEIKNFKPEDFWYIDALLKCKEGDFTARVVTEDKDNRFLDEKIVKDAYGLLEKAKYGIEKIERKAKEIKPSPPFDTASLQTTASTVLGFPVKKTAKIAQELYEKGKCFLPGNYITDMNTGDIISLENSTKEVVVNSISFNKKLSYVDGLKRVICSASKFVKKYDGKIITIKLNNRTYKVTPDHIFPVFNADLQQIVDKEASNLIKDKDYLIIDRYSKRFHNTGKIFNLLDVIGAQSETDMKDDKDNKIYFKFDNDFINDLKDVFKLYDIEVCNNILSLSTIKYLIDANATSISKIAKHYLCVNISFIDDSFVNLPFYFKNNFYYYLGCKMVLGDMKIDNNILNSNLNIFYGIKNKYIEYILSKFGLFAGLGVTDLSYFILAAKTEYIKVFISGLVDANRYCKSQFKIPNNKLFKDKFNILLSELGVYNVINEDNTVSILDMHMFNKIIRQYICEGLDKLDYKIIEVTKKPVNVSHYIEKNVILDSFIYEPINDIVEEDYTGFVYCLQSCNDYFLINNGLWTHNCTYIRTDSFSIAEEALIETRNYIDKSYSNKYLSSTAQHYKKKEGSGAQEAHECIRPTHIDDEGDDLDGDNSKLYNLIRSRFLACQMKPAIADTVTYNIKTNTDYKLIAKGQTISFDGWMKVYKYNNAKEEILPNANEKEMLELLKLKNTKNETQPPPRYNDASLVKRMEKDGVGRPSTYPTIVEGIKTRGYVEEIKGKKGALGATELGLKVYDYLQKNFEDFIMDIKFTATLETDLDIIENGSKKYIDVVSSTYKTMMTKIGGVSHTGGNKVINSSGVKCLVCESGSIIQRKGKFGLFYCCDRYPECKAIFVKNKDDNFEVKTSSKSDSSNVHNLEDKCTECAKHNRDGHLIERKGKYGVFYGCSCYPKCNAIFTKDDNGKFILKNVGNKK